MGQAIQVIKKLCTSFISLDKLKLDISPTPATKESLDQRSGLLYWCPYESKLVEIITIKAALKVTFKISTTNFPFILSSKNRKI